MKIAITGGLGTGKSTVTKIIASALQTAPLDSDQLCRQQMEPGTDGYAAFVELFGSSFLQQDGSIDRSLLRHAVFDEKESRKKLEDILHPIVRQQISFRWSKLPDHKKNMIVEVPLLYEVGWQDDFDICVVVSVPVNICVQRVKERDGLGVEVIRQILDAQLPLEKKLDYADFVIDNSSTFVSTVQQVGWLVKTLKENEKRR